MSLFVAKITFEVIYVGGEAEFFLYDSREVSQDLKKVLDFQMPFTLCKPDVYCSQYLDISCA